MIEAENEDLNERVPICGSSNLTLSVIRFKKVKNLKNPSEFVKTV